MAGGPVNWPPAAQPTVVLGVEDTAGFVAGLASSFFVGTMGGVAPVLLPVARLFGFGAGIVCESESCRQFFDLVSIRENVLSS